MADNWKTQAKAAQYDVLKAENGKLRAALEMARDEREWLHGLVDEQTCSDLCDKTYEFQGCPSGTCSRETGLATFRIVTNAIKTALDNG